MGCRSKFIFSHLSLRQLPKRHRRVPNSVVRRASRSLRWWDKKKYDADLTRVDFASSEWVKRSLDSLGVHANEDTPQARYSKKSAVSASGRRKAKHRCSAWYHQNKNWSADQYPVRHQPFQRQTKYFLQGSLLTIGQCRAGGTRRYQRTHCSILFAQGVASPITNGQ